MGKKLSKVKIFSALEVANICGVVNQTAINWIKASYLKAFSTPGGQYRVYPEDLKDFLEQRGMRVPEQVLEALGASAAKKLLICQQDQHDSEQLKNRIQEKVADAEVQQAFSAFEAGRMLSDTKANLVIFDLDMEGVDSQKTYTELLKNSKLRYLFLSHEAQMNEDMKKSGIVLVKPVEMDTLISKTLEFL